MNINDLPIHTSIYLVLARHNDILRHTYLYLPARHTSTYLDIPRHKRGLSVLKIYYSRLISTYAVPLRKPRLFSPTFHRTTTPLSARTEFFSKSKATVGSLVPLHSKPTSSDGHPHVTTELEDHEIS